MNDDAYHSSYNETPIDMFKDIIDAMGNNLTNATPFSLV